jgi:hypothetical protein
MIQRGEGGQFVPWLCVEQGVSYWLFFTFNHKTSRTNMLRVAPTALLHPLAISFSVQTHTSVSTKPAASIFSIKNLSTLKMKATSPNETLAPT